MSERKYGNAGKGRLGLSFFIFVSTLPWDKSGVFPGLFDCLHTSFSPHGREKNVSVKCCPVSCFSVIDRMYLLLDAIDECQKAVRRREDRKIIR